MVTRARTVRRVLAGIALAAVAVFGCPATTMADPGDSNFGFSEACQQLQDGLDGIGIPNLPSAGDIGGTLCGAFNSATHPQEVPEAVSDAAWEGTFGKAVDSLLKGLGDALILSWTWWMKIPTSTTVSNASLFSAIREYTFALQILFLSMSLIICAIRLAMTHRSGAAEQATEAFRVLARSVFASAMFSWVLVAGTRASDLFAEWIIDESSEHDARGVIEAMTQTQILTAFSPGLIFVIALVGMVGALMQAVFAVVRQALLVVVVGVLPLAAASSGTHMGRAFHDRLLAWSIAFVLYKPCAALVYMIAFKISGTSAREITKATSSGEVPSIEQAQQVLVGVVLLCSAALVLPALMRLITPLTSLGGGISGAAATAGILGAAGGLGSGGRGSGAKSTPAGSVSGSGGGARGGSGGDGGGGSGTGARSAPPPPPAPPPGRGGGAGGGGASRPAGAAAGASGAKSGALMAASKGAGPAGAVAAGTARTVAALARGVDSAVNSASPPPPPVARASGAGRAAVPR